MKERWIATALALGLAVTLTACSDSGKDSGNMEGSGNMSGSVSQARNSVPGRTGYEAGGSGKATTRHRTAYDYLNDGQYTAGKDGQVKDPTKYTTRDWTQDARDLMRDAGNAVGDAGKAVGDAVGDLGNGVRNATRDIMNQ
ncbi:MAG: hypothetical protein ACOX7N_04690 [Lawsonibacter sp.]